ncbi:cupin domain-containing protein [Bradyrhizobium sp. U87765 SZCCT0131]|uniref:cupin domain-containing protein n=1 Tax=unclassified Bradyrhizobium TaxID=2631580 RepID=UPI001BA5553F|nr:MULTISPECIES: cupin domain-containing protein [unclassified Bradyrhizobium]MBR1217966.1 cupin domain-containing protein [Bradyrhizobium sp. U87765 SZCCT0131]MBR1261088.1 cupin domain-containing protein [Bradyrhizobium sp. U87765 SZCCT0134]MBR1303464.1 cupin domain-containing protein [Bradyrhizobium sp. U87765 SZCCT0110]MBR1319070.1 cupin domain-containing protein [Bradyrhizobium sp. U87765 SZCCT0109]MBR1347395.1 cupin domain-containing protein [Bradyrhizobium sp. U87765 SZCCT0048]
MTRKKSQEPQRDGLTNTKKSLGLRLRLARQMKGLTLKELAVRGGCSESLLSKVENGKVLPSLPMIHRVVQVLETNISWLFDEPSDDEAVIFRKGARPFITLDKRKRASRGVMLERIIPYKEGHLLQCNIHHLEVGGLSGETITHEGEEVGYVLAGVVELTLNGDRHRLETGDGFCFRSNIPHSYRNLGDAAASILWVCTPPTF